MAQQHEITDDLAWMINYTDGIRSLCETGHIDLPLTGDQVVALMRPIKNAAERCYNTATGSGR